MNDSDDRSIKTVLTILVILIVAVPVVMLVIMGLSGWDRSGTGMMGSWDGGWGLMMVIPGGLVLILVIVLILVVASDRPAQPMPTNVPYPPSAYQPTAPNVGPWNDPRAILDRRLASGEISIEEYNRIRSELSKR